MAAFKSHASSNRALKRQGGRRIAAMAYLLSEFLDERSIGRFRFLIGFMVFGLLSLLRSRQ